MEIRGYFGDIKKANEAVEKLKDAGFENSYVDANDHYIGNRNVQTNLPGTSDGGSLADLVLNSGSNDVDVDTSPLAAASPIVSGMGSFEEITDINYCVFVDTNDKNSDEAKKIMENMGATLDDPNVSRYKSTAKGNISIEKPDEQANQIYTNRK